MKRILSPVKRIAKKMCLNALLRNNLQPDEIASFEFTAGHPTICLRDGVRLSALEAPTPFPFRHRTIPSTHLGCVLAYLLRFKYPHCMPSERIKTGLLPRRWFPCYLHPQHQNTFYELPHGQRDRLGDRFQIKPGDRVLEIGPYIGFGALRMSKLVGPEGRVVSVEADKAAFDVLKLNLEQNHVRNVTALHYAVGDADGAELTFYKSGCQANSLVPGVVRHTDAVTVTCRTIKSLMEELQFQPDFLILTINGSEFQALEASRDALEGASRLRIVSPGWYDDGRGRVGDRIVPLLSSIGFTVLHTPGMHVFAYR